jgi:hypothetical protein
LVIDSFTHADVQCFGGSDGTATVFVSGGVPSYHYTWNSGATNATATTLNASTFTVTVTDTNNCTTSGTVSISQPTALNLFADSIREISCNNTNDGLIIMNASGGTAPYNYSSDGISFSSLRIFGSLTTGIHTFYARDAHNCMDTFQYNFINPFRIAPVVTSTRPESCIGAADGNIVITPTNGTPGFQYALGAGVFQDSSKIVSLTTNNYTAYVRDTNGCIDSVNLFVPIRPPLVLALDSINVTCNRGADGQITALLSGGESPYRYQLGAGTYTSANIFNALSAGTYTITVRDTNNCTIADSIIVHEPLRIQPTILSTTTVTCFGHTDGSVTIGHTNGYAPYRYSVDGTPFITSNTISSIGAGPHVAYVMDSTNCIDSVSFSTGNPSLIVTVLASRTNVSCFGGNNGVLQVSSSGGASSAYTYNWSNGDISNTADSLSVGTYYVTTTDSFACFVIDTFVITQPSLLVNTLANTTLLCYGNTNGTISSTTVGGTGSYSYLWNDPLAQTTATATGLSVGTYTVTVTDILGCQDVDSVTLTQPDSLTLSETHLNITCFGGYNGAINATASGGSGTLRYSIGGPFQLSGNFTGLTPGLYVLSVKDSNNCTKSISLNLIQPPRIQPTIVSQVNELCNGDHNAKVVIGHTNGNAPFQYSLDKIAYQASDSFTSLSIGNYKIYILDSLNCIDSSVFTITEPAPLIVTIIPTQNKCFNDSSGALTITGRGGTSPYQYSIDNGLTYQGSNSFTGLVAGTYYVKIKDNNGCISSASSTLIYPPLFEISLMLSANKFNAVG